MLDARNFTVGGQWAKNASTTIPPIPISGQSYRNGGMSREEYENGQAYDVIWESARNNQKDYEISGIAGLAAKYGITPWSPLENYPVGAIQLGTDEIPYRCMKAHGPATANAETGQVIGPKDPTNPVNIGADAYWMALGAYLGIGAGASGANVAQPAVLAPEAGTTMQSLGFDIAVSPLELLAGGVPQPSMTRWRVLDENGRALLSQGEVPYTTTPTISAPEAAMGENIQVVVRHLDAEEGLSPWSEQHQLAIASVLANKTRVLSPSRNATGVIPVGLTVEVSEGGWTDGSAFAGTHSRLQVFSAVAGADAPAYDSGWIPYTTEFAVPDGMLATSTTYWARARHRASTPPAGNAEAILDTPWYGIEDEAASVFMTTQPLAPSITALTHTIPSGAKHGTQVNFTIKGATSNDGGAVLYRLDKFTGGLSASKTTGIVDDEIVTLYVPTIAGVSQPASVQIVAYSSFGAEAAPVTANVTILAQTVWVYNSPGTFTFTAPATMSYKVYAGGGGGGANNGGPTGGGGGVAWYKTILTQGSTYSCVVGAGAIGASAGVRGGTSSFNNTIFGYGGTSGYSQPPYGPDVAGVGGGAAGGAANLSGGNGIPSAGGTGLHPGGGGGAGTTNGGAGGLSTPGASGGYVPELGYATGTKGGYSLGGWPGIAGGGAGGITPGIGQGGNGSVVIVADI